MKQTIPLGDRRNETATGFDRETVRRTAVNEFIHPMIFLRVVSDAVAQGECITVNGTGDSMRPFIQPETDRLTLAPLPETLRTGDICLYVREGNRPIIHRIYKKRHSAYDMLGDNQYAVERGVRREQLIAVVSQRLRNGKVYDCLRPTARLRARLYMAKRRLYAGYLRLVRAAYRSMKKNDRTDP